MVRFVDRRSYSNSHKNNGLQPTHQHYYHECSPALQDVLFGRHRQQQSRRQLLLIRIVVCVSLVLSLLLLVLQLQHKQHDTNSVDISKYTVLRNLLISSSSSSSSLTLSLTNHTPSHDIVNDDAEHLQDTSSSSSSSAAATATAIPTIVQSTSNKNKIDNDDDTYYNIATTAATIKCDQMTNSRDIIDCLINNARNNNNKYMTKAFYTDPICQSITTWEHVQYCLMGRYDYNNNNNNAITATSNKPSSLILQNSNIENQRQQRQQKQQTSQSQQQRKRIREIHILGERNSGTKFVTQFLQQCFTNTTNGYSIRVHRDFLRSKHFFQPIPQPIYDYSTSLIVVVVRDPAEWMAAMVQYPYHSPNHIIGYQNGKVIPLAWHEFVNRTWIPAQRSYADRKELITQKDREDAICTQQFRYHQVQPCKITEDALIRPPWNIPSKKIRGFYPVYEQRHFQNRTTTTVAATTTNYSYDHLLQLRADKIINFVFQMSLLVQIGGFLVVRYEDILRHGNEFVLQQMTSILQNQPIVTSSSSTTSTSNNSKPFVLPRRLPSKCSIIPPQPNRIGKRYIEPKFVQWINHNIDIETEQLIGYR